MKLGKEYEILIANLYQSLEPNAEVTHDDYIFDETAKIKRQIDVSIKYKLAGVDILIIVQAKDYKHKANVTVVDQFKTVINDTKANKGILICSKGFSDAALTKAAFYNIECLTVHSALNKKWETILKIPVKQVVHEFYLDSNIILNIAHKAGKQVEFIDQAYSYNGTDIIGISDIILDHIIKKMGWSHVIRPQGITIDLGKMNLYHAFDNEMLPVENGYLKIKYKKSTTKKFYIDPVNYTYTSDHIKKSGHLHDLTISEKTLEDLYSDKYVNDKNVKDKPILSAIVYKFNDWIFHMIFEFSVMGKIEGNLVIKDKMILQVNDRVEKIIELERMLKMNK